MNWNVLIRGVIVLNVLPHRQGTTSVRADIEDTVVLTRVKTLYLLACVSL